MLGTPAKMKQALGDVVSISVWNLNSRQGTVSGPLGALRLYRWENDDRGLTHEYAVRTL